MELKPLSPDDRLRFMLIFHNVLGVSVQDIAKHYDLSTQVVEEMLRTTKKPLTHRGILQNMGDLYQRWSRGEQIKTLADEYNCSRHALRRALYKEAESISPGLYMKIVERRKREQQNNGAVWRPRTRRPDKE
jgi:Mor family transcriptional regulator